MKTKRIEIDLPDMDENGYTAFELENANITCSYDATYNITEIQANKSGLVALAKVLLQLAMSEEETEHTEMDEHGYFEKGSSGLSVIKKDNT